jgi:hypothetical protein
MYQANAVEMVIFMRAFLRNGDSFKVEDFYTSKVQPG